MATRTWTGLGGDANWTTAGNWDVLPVAGDDLIFAGVTQLTNNNDFAAATSFASITFAGGAGAFVLNGNQITLTGNITNNDNDLQTINLAIVINGTRTVNAASGNVAIGGVISGTGNLTKTGANTLTLSGANTYSGGTTTLSSGTLILSGGNDRLPTGTTLALTGGTTTFALGTTNQTLHTITTPDLVNTTLNVTGSGSATLTLNGTVDFVWGTGGNITSLFTYTLNMSGLPNFVFNAAANSFRVAYKAGTTNSAFGNFATQTIILATNNTITAITIGVGNVENANNNGGTHELRLGVTNNLYANDILLGNDRSNCSLNFNAGSSSVTMRNTDTVSAVSLIRVGQVATFNATSWTSTVDFSSGSVNALVQDVVIALANALAATNRTGICDGSLIIGNGTFAATTVTVGMIDNSGGGTTAGTYRSNGVLTLNHASGVVTITTLKLAENLVTSTGGTREVNGTVNVTNGTLQVTAVQLGAQTGTATATRTFNWTTGTIQNISGGNLTWTNVPITLASGTHTFNIESGRTATLDSNSPIGGAFTLAKAGLGTLITAATNTYTGVTTISAGTYQLGNGGATGSIPSANNITNNAALVYNRTGTFTYTGVISGTGTVTKNSSSTLIYTGTNTYSGTTTINAGTLQLGNGGATGSILNSANIVNNATLAFNNTGTYTYANVISGTGVVTKSASGTITLTAANTYSGSTTLNAGTININSTSAIGTGTFIIAGGTIDNTSGAPLTLSTNNPITWNGGFTFTGTFDLNLGTGAVTLTANRQVVVTNVSALLTIGGNISGSFSFQKDGAGMLKLTGTSTFTNGVEIRQNGTLILTNSAAAGTGTLNLNNATLIIQDNGVGNDGIINYPNRITSFSGRTNFIYVSNNGANTGNTINFTSVSSDYGNSTLNVNGANGYKLRIAKLNLNGGGTGTAQLYANTAPLILGEVTNSNAFNHTAGLRGTNTESVLENATNGTTTLSVTKTDSGTWTVTGDCTYTGTTTITDGTLQLGNGGATGSILTSLSIVNNAALVYNRTGSFTYSGVISGTGTVTKNGSSTLILTGTNTYSGATAINAGTVLVNGAINGGGSVTVGGTLGGTGTVTGAITLVSGGTIAPGAATGVSIGTLITSNTTFVAGSTYSVDLNGTTPTFDQINSSGTVDCGSAALTIASLINVGPAKTFTIINAAVVSGIFAGLPNNTIFTVQSRLFRIRYTATQVLLEDTTEVIWDGGGSDNNWTTAENWVSDVVPAAGSALQFDGVTRLFPNNNFAADTSFASITFNSGAGAFTLGGNRITLTGGIINNSANLETIDLDIIRAGNVTWTPAQISVMGWYDADDASTITQSAGAVSQWNDKGPNGFHVSQGTAANQPTTGVQTIGGKNAIHFDGNDTLFRGSGSYAQNVNGVLSITAYKRDVTATPTNVVWEAYRNGGAQSRCKVQTEMDQWSGAGRRLDGNSYQELYSVLPFDTNPHVFACLFEYSVAQMNWSIDGTLDVAQSFQTAGNTSNTTSDGLFVGGRTAGGSEGLNGRIGELVIVENDTSTIKRQILEGYLAWKWSLNGNLPATHPYKLQAPLVDDINAASGNILINGVISGSTILTKTGSFTLTLAGTNTYTGGTIINAGTLQLGNGGTTGSITSSASITNNSALVYNRTGTFTYGGVISGAGTLTKNGTSVLTLTATNIYTGSTTVNAGALLVNGAIGTGTVTVAANATLGGTGTVNGAVTVMSGGILAPGATTGVSIGTLSIVGTLTLGTGRIYSVDLNGTTPTFDQLNLTGSPNLNNATLVINSFVNPITGRVYTIVNASVALTGIFATLPQNAILNVSGRNLRVNYTGNTATLTDLGPGSGNSRMLAMFNP